jgi:lysophospholipase L1-like esterase
MAAEELPPELATLEDPDRAPREDADRSQPVTAKQAGVTLAVCLALWAMAFAPTLERTAHTAPPGARRDAALAVLRPVAVISDVLAVGDAAEGAMRALGRDPNGPPGGQLVIPELEPPDVSVQPDPSSEAPAPTTTQPASPTTPPPEGGRRRPNPPVDGAPPSDIRIPTERDRLRVVVVGDSLSQGLAPALGELFDPSNARVLSLGRISTGLARPDYFNWQAALRRIVDEVRPDVVFVLLGTNDDQSIVTSEGTVDLGTTDWTYAYRERWDFYRRLNDVYADTAAADPLAAYVDSWRLLETRDGGYAAYLRNERGVLQEMRAGDGFHFTPNGYLYLGRAAIRAAVESFGLGPASLEFSV